MAMIDLALAAVERGFRVFPLQPGSKFPFKGRNWKNEATDDPLLVQAMWLDDPEANVGIATGGGTLVLDIDTKNGKDGMATLSDLDPSLYADIATGMHEGRVVQTPSGGLHVYFSDTAGRRNTAGKLGVGLDTRGEDGYVLAPGSVVDGRPYVLVSDGPARPAPAWMDAPAAETRKASDDVRMNSPLDLDWAARHVAQQPVLAEGQGSDMAAFKLFAALHDRAISQEVAVELVMQWADRCGFDRDWIERKAENAYSYAQNEAGCMSANDVAKMLLAAHTGSPDAPKRQNRFAAAELVGDAISTMDPPTWVFRRLMEDRSLNLIHGGYSTKKTFLALDMALRAATGRDWAGHECAGPQRVVFCAGEGAFGLNPRVRAWAKRFNDGKVPETFRTLPMIPMAADPDDWTEFLEYVADIKPTMVFLDTVARTMVGLDEMSSRDMGLFVQRCSAIQALGAAVVLIHHEGKDKTRGSRGSNALPAAADLELCVELDDRGGVRVDTGKVKNAAEWAEPKVFRAELEVFNPFADEDGASLVLVPGELPPQDRADAKANVEALKAANDEPPEELKYEVQHILELIASRSPNSRGRSVTELAEALFAYRREIGIETRPALSEDIARAKKALCQRLRRWAHGQTAMPANLVPFYDVDKGGWGAWELTTDHLSAILEGL